tara:strand:- start:511388 stop:511570 length:183 start_codon:yes stop_codon:yes gene_type:complete
MPISSITTPSLIPGSMIAPEVSQHAFTGGVTWATGASQQQGSGSGIQTGWGTQQTSTGAV